MVRGSSEIFKKMKAMAILSAVLLSSLMMSGISSLLGSYKGSSVVTGDPASSYADLDRPTFLEPGKFLNYSVTFGRIPGVTNETTNLTASLHYQFNSIAGQFYSIREQTTHLQVSYGYTNPERVMGLYNTGIANQTLITEQYRGYSGPGYIRASVQNVTNFDNALSFTTDINMYTVNGSFGSASGNQTNMIVVHRACFILGTTARFYPTTRP
jgi:hypothetical protein